MPDTPEESSNLIFQWLVNEHRGWKLTLALLAVTIFIGGFLLLFQVVYPASTHQRLVPQRIILLDPASPAARQLVNSVSDRDFLVLGSTAPSPTAASPAVHIPVFEPGFKNFDIRVRDFLESQTTTAPLPRLFQADRAPLPALRKSPPTTAPQKTKRQSLQAAVVSGLPKRSIVKQVLIGNFEATGMSIRVGVAANGRITAAVPLATEPTQLALFYQLRSMLNDLRFTPAEQPAVDWGTIALTWKEAGK